MKKVTKCLFTLTSLLFIGQYVHCNGNNLIANNKTAYELAALACDSYLNYTFTPGATANACSVNGRKLCAILNKLMENTRLFNKPPREDLKELSRNAAVAFRNFDLSGSAADRQTFVKSLINLLQAVLPLLESNENTECRGFIQQLSKAL